MFVDEHGRLLSGDSLAPALREDWGTAGVDRKELITAGKNRSPIRVHDLRGTFITLALANGRSETWVADRTGHTSSQMINRYRRAARSATELELGPLLPMDQAIPEVAPEVNAASLGTDLEPELVASIAPLIAPEVVGHSGLEPEANGLREVTGLSS